MLRSWIWLVRAKRWAQHPPSERRVKLVFGVIAVALALGAVEYIWGWPEFLTVNDRNRVRLP